MTAPAPPRTPPTLRHVALPVALSLAALAAWLLWPRSLPPEPPLPQPAAPSVAPALPSSPHTPPSRPAPPPPSSAADVPAAAAPLSPASDASAPRVVLRGPWGDGPGQFGRRAASEGSPEAPNSVSIDASGDVAVLDQVNRRVQRFRDGRFVGSLPLPNEAAQDLATASDGRVAVLDRLGDPSLTLFDAAGRPARTVPLVGGPISEGGAITGLFAASDGLYVEREHRELVRLTDARGEPDPSRATLWGRPGRDGATLLRASIADRPRGMVTVSAAARSTGAMDWSRTVTLDGAILHLVLLDGDRHGRVYLGAVAGRELGGAFTDPRTLVVRFDRAGVPVATLRLPAPPEADELFRPLAIDDEGHVFALSPGPDGLSLVEYAFPD